MEKINLGYPEMSKGYPKMKLGGYPEMNFERKSHFAFSLKTQFIMKIKDINILSVNEKLPVNQVQLTRNNI